MEYFCAFDLVTEASRPERRRACSKPKRRMRSTPRRVKIEVSTATSAGVPTWIRPPAPEYSPSVFSRMQRMSKASDFSGPVAPGKSLCGRMLANWSKDLRIGSRSPCSETASGTRAGQPTAPRRIAAWGRSWSIPSSGIMRPVAR